MTILLADCADDIFSYGSADKSRGPFFIIKYIGHGVQGVPTEYYTQAETFWDDEDNQVLILFYSTRRA